MSAACSSTSDTPTSSDEQTASIQPWIALWASNPRGFVAEAKHLPETEKVDIVRKILEDRNQVKRPLLCEIFGQSTQHYCLQLLNRSHIWDVPMQANTSKPNMTPVSSECTHDWCRTQEAVQHIKHDGINEASQLCASIQSQQSKEECFFQISEQIAVSMSLELALRTCEQVPSYLEHCRSHAIEQAALSFESPKDILPVIAKQWTSPTLVQHFQQYYLTLKALHSPNNSLLPEWDRNSAQTLLFLQRQPKSDRALSAWITDFQKSKSQNFLRPITLESPIVNYWIQQGQQVFPSTLYLSLETRPFSKNSEEDLRMAMVAALLQLEFPVQTITQEESHPTLQWMLNRASHKR